MTLKKGSYVKVINKQSLYYRRSGLIIEVSKHISNPIFGKQVKSSDVYFVELRPGKAIEFFGLELKEISKQTYLDDYEIN